jgi:hypothetical protein
MLEMTTTPNLNIGDPSNTPSTSSGAVATKSSSSGSATTQLVLSITGLEGKGENVNGLESNQTYTAIIENQDGSEINNAQFFMTGLRLMSKSQADENKKFAASLGQRKNSFPYICLKSSLKCIFQYFPNDLKQVSSLSCFF